MARPIAAAGFAYLVGLMFAAFALPSWGFLLSAGAVLLAVAISVLVSLKSRKFTPAALAAICLVLSFVQYTFVYTCRLLPDLEYGGLQGETTAVILDAEVYPGYTLYSCRLESFDSISDDRDIEFMYTDFRGSFMDEGDRFEAILEFETSDTVYISKNISSSLSRGIVLQAKLSEGDIEVLDRAAPPDNIFENIREYFSIRMKSNLPLSGSDLADAMLFGNRNGIRGITEENFRLSGAAHMLAISGFHLTVLMGVIQVFCEFIGLGRKSRSVFTGFFVLLYMFITGFSYPVVRAGIMALTVCLGQISGREADRFSTLSLAVLVICVISPMAIWDYGFLLSVASMLGIILLHGKLHELCSIHIYHSTLPAALRFALRAVLPPVSVALCASLAVFPLISVSFRHFNLLSVVSGTLLSIPAMVLLSGGLATALLGDLGISRLTGMAVSFSAELMKDITSLFADIGGTSLPFTPWIFVLYFVILAGIFAISPRYSSGKKLIAAAVCCGIVLGGVVFADTYRVKNMSGIYVSVSEGGESVLFVRNGRAYASVSGNSLPYAQRKFVSDMGLEITGSTRDNIPGEVYSMFGSTEDIICETGAGISAELLGTQILCNSDQRVDGEPDILIQNGDKLDRPLNADAGELTVICVKNSADKAEIMDYLPAGRNIILEPGCGIFIEFNDGISVKKYDYGY